MNSLNSVRLLSRMSLPHAWSGRGRYVIACQDLIDLAALMVVWNAWHEDVLRPTRLHFICKVTSWVKFSQWAIMARRQLPEVFHHQIERLAQAWPIDVPGVQRFELQGQSVTITWCLGAHTTPDMLGVSVDVWIDDRDQHDEPALRQACHSSANHAQAPEGDHPWSWASRAPHERHALVVGAGFAGMGVAHSLALRGWRVSVLDKGWKHPGEHIHRDHLSAALTPVSSKDDNVRARLSRAGALRAAQRWRHLDDSVVMRCGALQLQRAVGRAKPLNEVVSALGFSPDWIDYLDAKHASARAGVELSVGGIWYPYGCVVRPSRFLDAMSSTPGIEVIPFDVHRIQRQNGVWQALNVEGKIINAPLLVIANAQSCKPLMHNSDVWPKKGRLSHMHALAGQITMIPSDILGGGPRCIVGGDGYVLPAIEQQCVSGGTYVRGAESAEITDNGVMENIERARSLLGLPLSMDAVDVSALPGWAGWRAVLPGRLPAIGPMPGQDGLWIATGYASRGLTWSALAGDLIAGYLESEPLPLESSVLNEIHNF